jgi:integrase
MRLGEALTLRWDDIDYPAKAIRIARAFSEDGTLDTPRLRDIRAFTMEPATRIDGATCGLRIETERFS